jgi:hypothetical protein
MRIAIISAAAALFAAGSTLAAPASVEVKIGPELQAKATKTYGVRELEYLATDLRKTVAARLADSRAYDGARIEMTLMDATPNRPTFKQMSDRPGLSFQSFGLGGARIAGQIVTADGKASPIDYKWYESDIRWEHMNSTWGDAQTTFQQFAARLGRGQLIASR